MTTKPEFIRDLERGLLPAHADCVRAGGSADDYNACMQKHFDRLWEKYGASFALAASAGDAGAVPAGWKLVPVQPTPEMIKAGELAGAYGGFSEAEVWARMLAAALSAPTAGETAAPQVGAAPADEREAFEVAFPKPDAVTWNGTEYVVREGWEHSYRCDGFVQQWRAWQARAALAAAPEVAALQPKPWCPDVCPITRRPFFMWIEHYESGEMVPTYGGPFDSYTIPVRDDHGDYCTERYDHDDGRWVSDSVEDVGVQIVDSQALVIPSRHPRYTEIEAFATAPEIAVAPSELRPYPSVDLPQWTRFDDLGGRVPSEVREAMREHGKACVDADRAAQAACTGGAS